MGTIKPNLNCSGTNKCFNIWLNKFVNLFRTINGALCKCSAEIPSSSQLFPFFMEDRASITVKIVMLLLVLLQSHRSSYFDENSLFSRSTLSWLLGVELLWKFCTNVLAMALGDVSPSTTGAKWLLFWLLSWRQDFQKWFVSLWVSDPCRLFRRALSCP